MKVAISRLLETSKFLNTKAGQELSDFFDYFSPFAEQVIRALQNGITLDDNENGTTKTVSLKHNTEQRIAIDKGKTVVEARIRRVVSSTYLQDSFGWWVNSAGELVVKAGFTGAPTTAVDCILAIYFE